MDKKSELWYVGWAVGLLILLALYTNFVQAFAEVPPADVACAESPFPNNSFIYILCDIPPHISKYVTPSADANQKGALLIPRYPTKKLRLRSHHDGYSAAPDACYNYGFSDPNYITTKNCPDHLGDPDLLWGGVGNWGGASEGGNPYGWRIAAMYKYADDHYHNLIDWAAGIEMEGGSYGGTTVILQSLMLPDPWARALISVVNAQVPQTLFVKTADPVGQYWVSQSIRTAWGGYDWHNADIIANADKLKNIYYRLNGSPADTSVVFDLDFFRKVCDDQKVACFGTFHNAGHNPSEPGIALPFTALYSGPDSVVRLDQMLPIFTNSSANYFGKQGHVNYGLEWRNSGFIDTSNRAVVPIRYVAHTNMGGDIPDQPPTATFDFTVRRFKSFSPQVGQRIYYTIGSMSGDVLVTTTGEITLSRITLNTGDTYSNLVLWRDA